VVCYFALSDKDKMKAGLIRLLEIPLDMDDDEDKYTAAQVSLSSFLNYFFFPWKLWTFNPQFTDDNFIFHEVKGG
jgi:hypothetical protein